MNTSFTNTHPSLRRGWLALCRLDEVGPRPQTHKLLSEHWVTWTDTAGTIRVFKDRCPHRLAPLSLGTCEGDGVRCAYHGWRFDAEGNCVEIPALGVGASLPPRAQLEGPSEVVVDHGMVFIAIDDPLGDPPSIDAAKDASFQVGDLPVIRARANAGLLADNFLDVAHFPFVHANTFGADEVREVPRYTVERQGLGFEASYEHDFANREDPAVAIGVRPLIQRRRLTYRYSAPRCTSNWRSSSSTPADRT